MSITTSLAACSTTPSANGPDGSVDAPSTLDDAIRYALSFVATLRDTRAMLGANTDITSLGSLVSVNGGQLAGMRNRIINGDFRVAQRGTSGTAPIGNTYTLDRWQIGVAGAAVTWSQVTAVTAFAQSESYLQINGAASNTSAVPYQRIESQNCRDFAGKTVSVGYWVYQTTGASVTVTSTLSYANATDNFSGITGIGVTSGTLVPNASWTFVSGTFAVPNVATTGLQLNLFAQGTPLLAGALLAISRVQIEIGSVATAFEQRDIAKELATCQRYYENRLGSGVEFNGSINTGSTYFANYFWHVTKRAVPSIVNAVNVGNNGFPASVGSFSATVDGAYESRVASLTVAQSNFSSSFAASAEL